MDSRPIGIFDSGLGGLTAVNALKASLPGESFVYVGDTDRVPYGERDADTLLTFSKEIVSLLIKKDVKAIIVACGTISCNVIEDLRNCFSDLPIIDVVKPGIASCLNHAKKRVGVIATTTTINSGFFQSSIKEKNPDLELEVMACPLFVPLIEQGKSDSIVTARIVEAYLKTWQHNPIDTLVLGCTHYPLLTPHIQNTLAGTVLIDMSIAAVKETKKYLTENNLINTTDKAYQSFYVSGDTKNFNRLAGQIMGTSVNAEKVYW